MDLLQQAANILMSVVSTMDTIGVTGLDNQDKFVGCANAIQDASKMILDAINACRKDDANAG